MNNFFLNLSRIIQSYTLGQRIVISTVLIGMVSALISLVVWASKPEYVALYTNVEPSMGSKMVNDLNAASIDYKLENGGKTILVPNSVAEICVKRGLLFVGLDIIGDFLTEINVTSPTCAREIDKELDFSIGDLFMECISKRL